MEGLQLFEALSSATIKILHLFLFLALSDWNKIPAFICTCNFDKKGKCKRQVKEFSEGSQWVDSSQPPTNLCIPPSIKLQSRTGEQSGSLCVEMQKCASISSRNPPLERILLGEQLMIHLALKWKGFWVKEATLNYRFEFSWRSNLPCMNKIFRGFGIYSENAGCLEHISISFRG